MTTSPEAERAAILRVIEDETSAYFNKDYEGWARCWVHEPYARRFGWYARGGRLIHVGWEQEASAMLASMKQYPLPNQSARDVRRENLTIRIGSDVAWVTFEQIAPKTGDPFDVPGRQHEVRILEKHAGAWKIACCFVLGSTLEFVSSPLLRVDERAVVTWMNAAADEELKQHGVLMLSGGRLRARNRADDQRLQAAIRWAAALKGYAAHQVAWPASPVSHGALPVVLGDKDAAAPEVCWVMVDTGNILVSFNDRQTTRQRLEVAAVIYGITPAQLRLAAEIIGGRDLVEAARRLGVSVNTARTHLKRMFEKTGVSSQAALVRVLLSVASPLA